MKVIVGGAVAALGRVGASVGAFVGCDVAGAGVGKGTGAGDTRRTSSGIGTGTGTGSGSGISMSVDFPGAYRSQYGQCPSCRHSLVPFSKRQMKIAR